MGCACRNKSRTASGTATVEGTYRVMVNGKQVYESDNSSAANTVAENFGRLATVLKPGETA